MGAITDEQPFEQSLIRAQSKAGCLLRACAPYRVCKDPVCSDNGARQRHHLDAPAGARWGA
jgi:hypothetical protein